MLFSIPLPWEASGTQSSCTRFEQSHLKHLPALDSGLGSARPGLELGSVRPRIIVWLDSELVSRLETRGLGSTLLEARLDLLETRLSSRLGSARLGKYHTRAETISGSVGLGLGSELGNQFFKNMLVSARSSARGSAVGSAGIRLGARDSAWLGSKTRKGPEKDPWKDPKRTLHVAFRWKHSIVITF